MALAVLCLASIAALAYAPSVPFTPIGWEDFPRLFSGSLGSAPEGRFWASLLGPGYYETFNVNGYYRPALVAYFRLNWELFGARTPCYQLAKLAVLVGSALLLYRLGVRVLRSRGWALAASSLYAAHALHGVTLQHLSFVDDLLCALFVLAALEAHRRYRDGGSAVWLAAVAASFLLALLSKETAVVLPVLMLLYDVLPDGRMRSKARACAPFIAAATAAAVWGLQLVRVGYGALSFASILPDSAVASMRLAAYAAGLFHPWADPAEPRQRAAAAAALAALAAVSAKRSPRHALFYAGWMLAGLTPALGIDLARAAPALAFDGLAAWRLNLASAGFCLLVAEIIRLATRNRPVPAALAVGLLLSANIRSNRVHARQVRTSFTGAPAEGWLDGRERGVLDSPFAERMMSLPKLRSAEPAGYLAARRAVEARLAVPGRPTVADLFAGEEIYLRTGRLMRVLEALSHKGFERFHRDLAEAGPLRFADSIEQAARLKDEGVALFPKDPAGAILRLERSRRLNPDNLHALLSLGAALAYAERSGEALACYDHALALPQEDAALREAIVSARARLELDRRALRPAQRSARLSTR